jgi:mannose-6-phosphate isomerase-like protein (cupin superfamily)
MSRKEREMPKASKGSASRVEDMGVMEGRYEELGGYTVAFETFREDADATPLFKGLPDDRCQSEHWGYVISGSVTFKYADRDEIYEAGDAYFAPPGHIPVVSAGTEVVEFSPSGTYEQTMEVVARNLGALQAS